MKGTWLLGATGVMTLVMAVALMAFSAPSSSAQHGTAITQSLVRPAVTQTAPLP
jgi:hypothetical protein